MEENNNKYRNNNLYNQNEDDKEELNNEQSIGNIANFPTSIIVILCIFIWPIGLILLILKYSSKNSIEAQTYKRLNITQNDIANTTNLNMLKGKKTSAMIGAIVAFVFGVLFFIVAFDQILFGGNITKSMYERDISSSSTNKYQRQNVGNSTDIAENKEKEIEKYKFLYLAVGGTLAAVCFLIGISKWIKSFGIGNKIRKIEIYQNLILIREIFNVNDLADYLKISKIKVLDNVSDMIREGYLCGIRIKQNKIERIPEYVDPNRVFNVICPSCGANNKYTKGIENKCEYCGRILNLNQFK